MPVINDMIRTTNPRIDEAAAQYLADLWNTAYPHMRTHLTDAITSLRDHLTPEGRAETAKRLGLTKVIDPTPERLAETAAQLKRYEIIRRELGQLDRGTHRPCTQSAPCFSLSGATHIVRLALEALPWGSPTAGDIYRLAAELSDLSTAQRAALKGA